MADRQLEIQPAALAELKSAVSWYLERDETAALNFVSEVDRALDLVIASPGRWPRGKHANRKFVLSPLSFCGYLSGNRAIYSDPGRRPWTPPSGLLERALVKTRYPARSAAILSAISSDSLVPMSAPGYAL